MPKHTIAPETTHSVRPGNGVHKATNAAFHRDLSHVRDLLQEIVTPEAAERWLDTPHAFLNHQTPLNLIRRGELEPIMEAIAQVKYGIHV